MVSGSCTINSDFALTHLPDVRAHMHFGGFGRLLFAVLFLDASGIGDP